MPTATYIPLANKTLTATAAVVSFSSIPATYRDLILIIEGSSTSQTYAYLQTNGNTGAVYGYTLAQGNGTTATTAAANDNKIQIPGTGSQWLSTSRTSVCIQIMDYAQTNKFKTYIIRSNNSATMTEMMAGKDSTTAAITSLTFTNNISTFTVGSTFALYGIAG